MQPHMAGTLQSKGRDDLGIFSTQTPLMILVFIKCSKSSRPSFFSSWPRKPGRQSCVEGCPCCRAPVRVKNRCLQSCEGCSSEIVKMAGRVHSKVHVSRDSLAEWRRRMAWARPPQLSLCVSLQRHANMAGTLQSKGHGHIFNTNTSYDKML